MTMKMHQSLQGHSHGKRSPGLDRLTARCVGYLLLLMLLLAPIVRGGNRQVALAVLLLLGLGILALLLSQWSHARLAKLAPQTRQHPAKRLALVVVVLAPFGITLFQLAPLGASTWGLMPGRADYLPALQALGFSAPSSLPLALNPDAAMASFWAAIPLAAALLAGLKVDFRLVHRAFAVILFGAALQMVICLMQYVQGTGSAFFFNSAFSGTFQGTFSNRNHVANYLVMSIPLWVALLANQYQSDQDGEGTWPPFALPMWWLLGFSILLVLFATQSRGGLLASAGVLLMSFAVFMVGTGLRLARRHVALVTLLLVIVIAAAASTVGTSRMTERFSTDTLRADANLREGFALTTMEGAKALWPWGSGLGSYESVYPRFQPKELAGYVSFAHNDYAQALMEVGLIGAVVAVCLLCLVLAQGWSLAKAWRGGSGRPAAVQQALAGVSVLGLLLHSWVEFNMHIPALALVASFLTGVMLRPLDSRLRPSRRGR